MAETTKSHDFGKGVMDDNRIAEGIKVQAEHCRRNGAPITARIVEAQLALMHGNNMCGQRIAHWPGLPLEDAMPLRLAGGFHHLHLTGADERLAPIYEGEISAQADVDAVLTAVTADHDARLLPWLDGPPQTNEAGRSASFMAALLWLSPRIGGTFELNEIGASAGINTMMDRYHYNLGGVSAGPAHSLMQIKPEWIGSPPPDAHVEIVQISGCDQAPVDLSDVDAALRVKSYVWPENADRLERMDAAIALAAQSPPYVVQADALDWVLERLSAPQNRMSSGFLTTQSSGNIYRKKVGGKFVRPLKRQDKMQPPNVRWRGSCSKRTERHSNMSCWSNIGPGPTHGSCWPKRRPMARGYSGGPVSLETPPWPHSPRPAVPR